MTVTTRVAPIFPVSDLVAALAYYRRLGLGARHWHSAGYGFVTFDGTEIHLGVEPDQHEGVLVDPDGNVIRFGSPMSADPGLP